MSSLFDLPLEPAEGSDVTKWYYQQVTANGATNINVDNTTTLSFQFAPQGRRWFVPSRSYFRIVGTAGAAAGTVDDFLQADDDTTLTDGKMQWQYIQPAVGGAANFFQSAKVMIGGTLVSSVENKLPLVEVVSKRIDRSSGFLNTHQRAANFWHSRLNDDGYQARTAGAAAARTFEYNWQPPLGFFQVDHAIPGMEMTIELITDPNWRAQAWEFKVNSEGKIRGKPAVEALKLSWQNVSVVFHAAFVEGPRADDSKFVLNFDEWSAHELPYNSQVNYTVKPETNLLVVGTQDSRVKDSLYKAAGRLLVYDALQSAGTTLISAFTKESNTLRQIQIEYNGQMFPAQPHSGLPGQLTFDNAVNTGHYSSEGNTEDILDYSSLGQMMVIQTPKDGTSYATAVGVHSVLEPANTSTTNMKLILLARAPKSLLVRTADSMVVTVQSSDVARTDRGLGNAQAAGTGMARRGLFGNFI